MSSYTHKQNTYLPGVHIEVKSPEEIKKSKPDYIITPWNLKNEIKKQLDYCKRTLEKDKFNT